MYIKIVLLILSLTCFLSSCINNENESLISQAQKAEFRIPFDSLRCLHPCRYNNTSNYVGNGEYIIYMLFIVIQQFVLCVNCKEWEYEMGL